MIVGPGQGVGGARGIGKEIALKLASEGAHVAFTDIRLEGVADEVLRDRRAADRLAYALHDLARAEDLATRFDILSRGVIAASAKKDDLKNTNLLAFYNAGVRLKGSEHGRADSGRQSYNISFSPDRKFRGVHDSVLLDRSGEVLSLRRVLPWWSYRSPRR